MRRYAMTPEDVERDLPLVVRLLSAWSSGDMAQADASAQEAAILVVRGLRHAMLTGTSPLDAVEEPTGSMADAGAALGETPRTATWNKEGPNA